MVAYSTGRLKALSRQILPSNCGSVEDAMVEYEAVMRDTKTNV
jgi:hypothetical protein